MRPKQGMESCLKHVQAERERQHYIPLALRGMGIAGYIKQGAGKKESL